MYGTADSRHNQTLSLHNALQSTYLQCTTIRPCTCPCTMHYNQLTYKALQSDPVPVPVPAQCTTINEPAQCTTIRPCPCTCSCTMHYNQRTYNALQSDPVPVPVPAQCTTINEPTMHYNQTLSLYLHDALQSMSPQSTTIRPCPCTCSCTMHYNQTLSLYLFLHNALQSMNLQCTTIRPCPCICTMHYNQTLSLFLHNALQSMYLHNALQPDPVPVPAQWTHSHTQPHQKDRGTQRWQVDANTCDPAFGSLSSYTIAHINTQIHTYIHTQAHTHTHTRIHTHAHMHTQAHTPLHTCAPRQQAPSTRASRCPALVRKRAAICQQHGLCRSDLGAAGIIMNRQMNGQAGCVFCYVVSATWFSLRGFCYVVFATWFSLRGFRYVIAQMCVFLGEGIHGMACASLAWVLRTEHCSGIHTT